MLIPVEMNSGCGLTSVSRVTIRGYESRDLEACRDLWVELTQWHRDIYDAPSIGGDDPGKQFDEHLEKVGPSNIWVAVSDDAVVGLTGLIPGEGEAEIEPVVVSRSYRGSGVGRKLVETAMQAARDAGVKHLSVRPVGRNKDAILFFKNMGLDIVGHVELFMKLSPDAKQDWQDGPELAHKRFRC